MKKYKKALVFDCFGTVFDMCGVPPVQILDYNAHIRSGNFSPYKFPQNWWDIKAHPDSAEGIKSIQDQGISCIALSNGSVDLIKHLSDNAGIKFDYIIDLVKHQVYKPHLDAYRAVAKDTPFDAEECMMITANPTFGDIEGSKAVGMTAIAIRQSDGYLKNIIDLSNFTKKMISFVERIGLPIQEM